MTWQELFNAQQPQVQQFTPSIKWGPVDFMYHASHAHAQMQDVSLLVRKLESVNIDPTIQPTPLSLRVKQLIYVHDDVNKYAYGIRGWDQFNRLRDARRNFTSNVPTYTREPYVDTDPDMFICSALD